MFIIRVADDSGEWSVARRFRNFETLHRAMRGCARWLAGQASPEIAGHAGSSGGRLRTHAGSQGGSMIAGSSAAIRPHSHITP